MDQAVTVALAGDQALMGVIGQLVAMELATPGLLGHGMAGQHRDAAVVGIGDGVGIAGHQIAFVVQFFDMRLGLGPGQHYMIHLAVGIQVDPGQIACALDRALGDHHVLAQGGDAIGPILDVRGIGDVVDRLLPVIRACRGQCRDQQQGEQDGACSDPALSERVADRCRGHHGEVPVHSYLD